MVKRHYRTEQIRQAVIKATAASAVVRERIETREQNNDIDLTQYAVPEQYRDVITLAEKNGRLTAGISFADNKSMGDAVDFFHDRRKQLQQDAATYFSSVSIKTRPDIEALMNRAVQTKSEAALIKCLYSQNQGVVIGEPHKSVASKHFLIDNMQTLKAQGVTILYLGHLLSDLHGQALQDYFSSAKNTMPEVLQDYLTTLDVGHFRGKEAVIRRGYTFSTLVKAAHQAGIQVVALDCTASYCLERLKKNTSGTTRHQMMNYFAQHVIQQHQATYPGKWVALVGNSHTNHFIDTPGLAELTGTPGLRIKDSDSAGIFGSFMQIKKDPGEKMGVINPNFVKGDLLLEINTTGSMNFKAKMSNAVFRN